jgi:hypothetical protein
MNSRLAANLLIIFSLLLSGCAIHPEGSAYASTTDEDDWMQIKGQLSKNMQEARVAGLKVEGVEPGLIVIGRVGPFRDFSNEAVFDDAYRYYSKIMVSMGESENKLTEAELKSVATGWTTITYAGMPQLFFLMSRAYVPPDIADAVDFSSLAGTIFGGAREDLVAALSTIQFPFFVISALLCEDREGYSECSNEYDWGLYDVYSGKELTPEYEIKGGGAIIDTDTFKIRDL